MINKEEKMPGYMENIQSKQDTSHWRLVIAFIVGFIITAAAVIIPAVTGAFSRQSEQQPTPPAVPGLHQEKAPGSELVRGLTTRTAMS